MIFFFDLFFVVETDSTSFLKFSFVKFFDVIYVYCEILEPKLIEDTSITLFKTGSYRYAFLAP